MVSRRVLSGTLVVAASLALVRQSAAQSFESEAVAFARALPLETLDSTLSGATLDEWLVALVAPGRLEYELDDCGEQTGHPETDRGRDFPACVSAYGTLDDGGEISVSVRVGTLGKGVSGDPAVAMVTTRMGNDLQFLPSLADLAAWMGHRRSPDSLDSLSPPLQTTM